MEMNGKFSDPKAAMTYILAGKAFITLVSAASGARFTYKVELADKRQPNDPDFFFVNVLNGPDNWFNYKYIGYIKNGEFTFGGAKAKMSKDAPSVKGFEFCYAQLRIDRLTGFEVWHEGKCGRCGKKLTVPSSIATGFGPDCADMVGKPTVDVTPVKVNGTPAQRTLNLKPASPRAALKKQLEDAVKVNGSPVPNIDAEIRRRITEYKSSAPENYYQDGMLDEKQAFNVAYNKFRVEIQKEGQQ